MRNGGRNGSADQPAEGPRALHLVVSRGWVAVLVVLLLVPWVMVAVLMRLYKPSKGAGSLGSTFASPLTSSGSIRAKAGPWGDLEYTRIIIAPPTGFIKEVLPGTFGNQWHFPNTDRGQLEHFLASVDLTETQRAEVLAVAQPMPAINGLVIDPPEDLIRGLSSKARAGIYSLLKDNELNKDQVNAFRFCGESADQWLGGGGLAPATVEMVRPLIYRNGLLLFFSDLRLVLPKLPASEERARLLKTLSREATMLVRLRISERTDVDALANYWARGGRAKDVRPILESLAQLPGTNTIDVTHLLPPFARRRIYTYPSPSVDANAPWHDCYWTALNFFSEQPDERYTNKEVVTETLKNEFYRVYSDYELGDVVLFARDDGTIIHAAVYIADDILYSKNGNRPSNPWMFIRLDEMKDYYASTKPLQITFCRRTGF